MDDGRGLTSGDPLASGAPERPARRDYGGGPVPPGAFAPRRQRPPAPPREALASFGRRVAAFLIDGVVILVLGFLLLAVVGSLLPEDAGQDDPGTWAMVLGALLAFVIAYPVVALLYLTVFMAATNGRTLGKLLLRCRVVRDDGRRVTFGWAAYREVLIKGVVLGVAAAFTAGVALLVDGLWPLWERDRRTLHDLVVDSRVVRT